MITVRTRVRIKVPADVVFDFVADPRNFPLWNSAVVEVRQIGPGGPDGVGTTYAMARKLPGGSAENTLQVIARERPTEFAVRTTSGPTPFVYRLRLGPTGDSTVVEMEAEVGLGPVADILGPIAGLAVRRGVDANLDALKILLESQFAAN